MLPEDVSPYYWGLQFWPIPTYCKYDGHVYPPLSPPALPQQHSCRSSQSSLLLLDKQAILTCSLLGPTWGWYCWPRLYSWLFACWSCTRRSAQLAFTGWWWTSLVEWARIAWVVGRIWKWSSPWSGWKAWERWGFDIFGFRGELGGRTVSRNPSYPQELGWSYAIIKFSPRCPIA